MRTHVDLFSGIGGFSLACEWVGVETVAFAEIDKYASQVLSKHWPNVPNYNDVRNVPAINDVWLLTAGVPCQPASSAGRRKGTADHRWLWPEALAAHERIRPRWSLFENPVGILSLNGGVEFEHVCASLEGQAYEVWPLIVPACAVGAWHRRDRVWIIAHAKHNGLVADQVAGGAGARVDPSQGPDGAEQPAGSGGGEDRAASMADPDSQGSQGRQVHAERADQWPAGPGSLGHAPITRLPDWAGGEVGQPGPLTEFERPSGREVERDFRGVAHGVSDRVGKLRCLGNAIVPQVAYQLVKRMIEAEYTAAATSDEREEVNG